jgi:hypothetical protein
MRHLVRSEDRSYYSPRGVKQRGLRQPWLNWWSHSKGSQIFAVTRDNRDLGA